MTNVSLTSPRKIILFCLATVLIGGGTMTAQAQSVSKRLENIEKQIKAIQRKVFTPGSQFPQKGGAPSTTAQVAPGGSVQLADIEARLSQLETQLRQLTGRIEEGGYQLDKLKQQMETMARDYEFRFKELEKATPAAPGDAQAAVQPTAPAGTDAAPADILPAGSEEDQYSYAQKLVTMGQYAKAEAALVEFLKRYPQADLTGNAQYWLGQTYYVRKMYTTATRTFLEGYNTYPKSPKAPAFLLKIGMSLYAMGEKADACDAYRELASRYPDSIESKSKRPPEEKRAGCR